MPGRRAAIALIFLLAIATAQAQTATPLADDPSGDMQANPGGVPVPVGQGAAGMGDLARLAIVEEADRFDFIVELHPASATTFQSGIASLSVFVTLRDTDYEVALRYPSGGLSGGLFRIDNQTGIYDLVSEIPVDVSTDTLRFTGQVARELLTDASASIAFPGAFLTKIYAQSSTLAAGGFGNEAISDSDRMPDTGYGADYEVQLGSFARGSAKLLSPSPARASNGEAATYLFPVTARNEGSAPAAYQLEVVEQPAGWQVQLPVVDLTLQPGEDRNMPVLVSSLFRHQHGTSDTVLLRLTDLSDPGSVAELQLVIKYHATPQPAGHHNELYIHSRIPADLSPLNPVLQDQRVIAYMNTLAEDDQDAAQPVRGGHIFLTSDVYMWNIPLHPSLQMGLDFNVNATGLLRVPLTADIPIPGATLFGHLTYIGGEQIVLGEFARSAPFDLAREDTTTVELIFTSLPEADYVAYNGTASLMLDLFLDPGRPAGRTATESPILLPGATLDLPLFEYRDPIDPILAAGGPVTIAVEGPNYRRANAGDAVLFDVQLVPHTGGEALTASLTGVNSAWATLERTTGIDGGDSSHIGVFVRIPADSFDGDIADLVLQIHDDAGTVSLARFVVEVDEDAEHESTTTPAWLEGAGKDTPTGIWLPLVVLVVMLMLRRRQ